MLRHALPGSVFLSGSPLTLPLNVLNASPKSVSFQATADMDGLRLHTPEKPVGPGKTCTIKVTVNPQRVSRTDGNLQLKGGKWRLQVPYSLQLLNGSLQATNSKFYIGAKGQRAFSVEVTNTLNTGLRIERILVDSSPVAAASPASEVAPAGTLQIPLPPVQYQQPMAKPQKSAYHAAGLTKSASPHRYNASLRVLTNVTEFVYKLEFYSNKLDLLVDRRLLGELAEKGKKPPEVVFDAGTQGIRQKKKFFLELYNPNPVEVTVEHVSSNVSTSHMALPSPPPWSLAPYRMLQLALTLSSPEEGRTWGLISVKTDFHSQYWPFVFQTSKGTVTAAAGLDEGAASRNPGIVSMEGAFPFRHSSELIYLESSFDAPLVVAGVRVEGEDPRFSVDLVESPVLHPGAKSLLGTLKYQPTCASPTSCYVGLGGPLESSSSKDLYLWRGMQERLKETRALNISLVVDTLNVKGFIIPVTVSHVWPRVTPRGAVRFETTRLGQASETPVVVDNPSDQPLMMQAYVSTTGGPEVHSIVAAQHAIKLGHLSSAFSLARSVQNSLSVIPPRSKKKILVRFEPPTIGPHVGVLVVRNNLTAVSSVLLRGEGGLGKLLLAGQEPGGTILFDLNAALLKDCSNIGLYTTLRRYPVARNVGQLPIRVQQILVNERACVGFGFRVKDCEDFVIKPNASHRIELSFTPDFTVSRVEVVLSLVLDDTTLDFNVVVTLPKSLVSTCAEQVVRPPWEGVLYVACLILSIPFVLCVLCYAFLDANRVLQETLFSPRYERQGSAFCRSSTESSGQCGLVDTANNLRISSDSAYLNHIDLSISQEDRADSGPSAERAQLSTIMRMFSSCKRMVVDWLNARAALGDDADRGGAEQRNSVATQTGMDGDGQTGSPVSAHRTAPGSGPSAGLCYYDRKGSLHKENNNAQTGSRGGGGSTGAGANSRRRDSGSQGSKKEGSNRRNRKKEYIDSYVDRVLTRSGSVDVNEEPETGRPSQTASDCDPYGELANSVDKVLTSRTADVDDRDRSNTPVEAEAETTSEDSSEASTESGQAVVETPTIEEVVESEKLEQTKEQKLTRRERKEKRKKRESNNSPVSAALTTARVHTGGGGGGGGGGNNNNKDFKDGPATKESNEQNQSNGLSATLPDVCVSAASAQRKPPPHTPSPPAEQTTTPPAPIGGAGRERRRDSRGAEMHSRHEREIPPRFKKQQQQQQIAPSFRAALPLLAPQEVCRQLTPVAPVPRTISYSAVVSGGHSPPTFSPSNAGSSAAIGGYSTSSTMPLSGLGCPTGGVTLAESCSNDEQEMAPLIRSIIDSVIPAERDERATMSWVALGTSAANKTGGGVGDATSLVAGSSLSASANSANDDVGHAHALKSNSVGGRNGGRLMWGSVWRNSGPGSSSNTMTAMPQTLSGSPSSPTSSECTPTGGLLSPSRTHESGCSFGSASMVPVAPPSQTFPTFLRRTPERERERDRQELGLDLHQRHLNPSTDPTGSVSPTSRTQPAHWSSGNAISRHLQIPRSHQLPQRLCHPPAVSPTNDYSYNGADIWGSGSASLSSPQPPLFPSPIGTPWTPFRSPSLSLSAVREADNTGKKSQ
ncbi:hypothetical protein BIW11_09515 [Tropilaelaps mercedesae]|uniref:TMEM131L fifth Ig-like domain-containing protein n=1 Tax=Tropilaelaps mercedesae TaxID=418985 RepID=A0A1V9XJS9_9ACAR|nr:hypothetical protein BIW11_09515 [Tropilaelaps mercedesae]